MFLNAIKGLFRQPFVKKNVLGVNYTGSSGTAYERFFYSNATNAYTNFTQTTSSFYVQTMLDVGFDDTPVTAEDYKLSDGNMTILNGYSGASSWAYKQPLTGKEYLTIIGQSNNSRANNETINKTVVYQNNTDHDVVVKEIGLYEFIQDMPYSNSTYWTNANSNSLILAFRKVLENPITFHPGDVYAITYRIALDI